MKKLLILLAFLAIAGTANAQKVKLSKQAKDVRAKSSKWVSLVDGFALIWFDTEGRMDLYETEAKINPEFNPDLTYIKDEELGVWRLAVSMEENQRMADKMSVIKGKYKDATPYKRTGYIE